VGVLARLGQQRPRTGPVVTRLAPRRRVAVWGASARRTPRRWRAAVRQGLWQAPQGVWLRDGGRGVWRLCAERFAGPARGIVDCEHAAPPRWQGAAAWWEGRTSRARRWCRWARHRRRHGRLDGVRAALAEACDVAGVPETARETRRTVSASLPRHREPINDDMDKERGLPLGSGLVASACQGLMQQRCKGVGRRWREEGFHHLLHRRRAWVNGRFEAWFGLALSPNS
jgi:hypothetical protein